MRGGTSLKAGSFYKSWALGGVLIRSGALIWSWALIRAFNGIWIHVLCVSTNQNAYVTKTFWIRHESGNFIAIVKVVYFYPFYKRLVSPPGGEGVLPKKLTGGVRPASQTPYPIYDQNLCFCQPYLWLDQKFDTLFMTWPLNQYRCFDCWRCLALNYFFLDLTVMQC